MLLVDRWEIIWYQSPRYVSRELVVQVIVSKCKTLVEPWTVSHDSCEQRLHVLRIVSRLIRKELIAANGIDNIEIRGQQTEAKKSSYRYLAALRLLRERNEYEMNMK